MKWVVAGVVISLVGVAVGIATKNAPLFCCGFIAFGAALGASDGPVDRHNAEVHDALDANGQRRIGYEDDRRVA